ncbi:sodium/glutamate symporter [Nesterenkonia flava]|uniref:Sodium/glutamate symporter n=1 Tax=Nesterenkonia flava TaxID=469799 RepID=A0ABU1FPW2_9MICC|nr:sodium/glutamate symporter [Nesterenkonia flava]MDR5710676.1 sodium/glutamate symporter [Nesterenkonia flava]
MTAWNLFTDLGFICLLLLTGAFLRAKVRIIQSFFLPASLIAGVLGLVLGPHMLGVIPFSEALGDYAGILIAVVFAALPFTSRLASFSQAAKNVVTTWAVSQAVVALQWGVGLLFGLGVLAVVFSAMEIPDGFGLMLAAGFMGGHGTAAAIAEVYGEQWAEAQSLGMTAATVGIMVSVIGGIMIIKYESQRGGTAYLKSFKDLPEELRTGIVHTERRQSVGVSPVSTMSIDPLIYHAGLILGVAGISYLVASALSDLGDGISVPTFSVAFLLGFVVLFLLKLVRAQRHFDQQLFERTSSSATDLLVAFGIASINPGIVVAYAGPLALLLGFGVLFILGFYFLVAKRLFTDHQVEQSIFLWGWNTGTVAMGIALLRVVDPEMRSKTLDYYGVAYVPIGFADIAIIALLPVLVMGGFAWPAALVLTAAGIALLVAARLTVSRSGPKEPEREVPQPSGV